MTNIETSDMHRPSDVFRQYLEGEVTREYRRRRLTGRLRAAAVILVSVGLGMSVTLASAQVRVESRRDSLMESAKAEALLAALRYTLAQSQLKEAERQVSVGAATRGSLGDAELQLARTEYEVARTILNSREIEASGLPARDDLNAPLVKGEDFVKERLNRQMMLADRQLQQAERARDEAARRAAVGAEVDDGSAEAALLRARAELVVLSERLKARTEYLAKGTPVADLVRRIDLVDVQQQIIVAQKILSIVEGRAALAERRQKVGAATEIQALVAQLDVKLQQVQLQQLIQRLNQLKAAR